MTYTPDDVARAIITEGQTARTDGPPECQHPVISERGIQIALSTAEVETRDRVLANPDDPASEALPNDGDGEDHASEGEFQQQPPWWGTVAERMDLRLSAAMFYNRLAALDYNDPGTSPGTFAYRVQNCAAEYAGRYDEAFGAAVDQYNRLTAQLASAVTPAPGSIPAANVDFIDREFDQRLGSPYQFGCCYCPDNPGQGCDCSYLVGWVLEGYTKGPQSMSWAHNVSTESWPYDYDNKQPAAAGTVGPYGTIAIASPQDLPADAALLICIMHGGGGEYSHMNCLTGPAVTPTPLAAPAGKIMESNGGPTTYPAGDGTCTNGTGGTPADWSEWTDWWYLPGPIVGDVPPPPPRPATYTVQTGDTLSGIAAQFNTTDAALLSANPSIGNPNLIYAGQVLAIPSN